MMAGWEKRSDKLAPLPVFLRRMLTAVALTMAVVAVGLVLGMAGYTLLEHMGWIDAFENASMILSGMGPVEGMRTDAGKIFAGAYAIFSGIVVIASTSFLLAPVLHRVLHRFHIEDDQTPEPKKPAKRSRR